MADRDSKTKVVFSDGGELLVSDDATAVRKRLSDDILRPHQPFTELTMLNGSPVYVAAGQVAYVQDLGLEEVPGYPPGD